MTTGLGNKVTEKYKEKEVGGYKKGINVSKDKYKMKSFLFQFQCVVLH
jgi:hypothetical protein